MARDLGIPPSPQNIMRSHSRALRNFSVLEDDFLLLYRTGGDKSGTSRAGRHESRLKKKADFVLELTALADGWVTTCGRARHPK